MEICAVFSIARGAPGKQPIKRLRFVDGIRCSGMVESKLVVLVGWPDGYRSRKRRDRRDSQPTHIPMADMGIGFSRKKMVSQRLVDRICAQNWQGARGEPPHPVRYSCAEGRTKMPGCATIYRAVQIVSVASSGTAPSGAAAQSKVRSFSMRPAVRKSGISNRVSQLRPLTPHQSRSTGIWSPIGLSRKNSPVSGFDQNVAASDTPWAARPSSKEYQCASFALQDKAVSPVFAMSNATGVNPSVPRFGAGPCPCAEADMPKMERHRTAGASERKRLDTMDSSDGGKKIAVRQHGD